MAKSKFPGSQLNLLNDFAAAENPKLEAEKTAPIETPETEVAQPPEKESAADKAIREIYEKIEIAKAKQKREDEGKWVETSLKKIRAQVENESIKPLAQKIEDINSQEVIGNKAEDKVEDRIENKKNKSNNKFVDYKSRQYKDND